MARHLYEAFTGFRKYVRQSVSFYLCDGDVFWMTRSLTVEGHWLEWVNRFRGQDGNTVYMPVLKAKAGELAALRQAEQNLLTPLIEIPAPDGKKTLEDALKKVATDLRAAWDHEIHVDVLPFIRTAGEVLPSGTHILDFFNAELSKLGITMIPVTGIGRSTTFQTAVKRVAAANGRGAALRLQGTDLDHPTTVLGYAQAAAGAIGLTPPQIDMIVDVEALTTATLSGRITAVTAVLTSLSSRKWRSYFVVAGGYPGNPTGVVIGSVTSLPRADWNFWLTGRSGFPVQTTYGDYGVDTPTFTASGGRAYSNIKYTTLSHWLFIRGENVTTPGGYGIFNDNCRILVAHSEFKGAAFSAGDNFFNMKATTGATSGNATQWRMAMYSHHIAMVLDQLSIMGAPHPVRRGPPATSPVVSARPTAKKSRVPSSRKSKS